MKKTYKTPEIEISLFDTKDVITASGAGTGTDTPIASSMTNGGALSDNYSDGNYDSIFGS